VPTFCGQRCFAHAPLCHRLTASCRRAGHVAEGSYVDLNEDVPDEARVGAVYALHAAYHTQQCKALVRIYAGPADVRALHEVLEVRARLPAGLRAA
jgi:hypothetical protein